MKKIALLLFAMVLSLNSIIANEEKELLWPKEIEKDGAVVVLYQPQLESFKGNTLEGRLALSVTIKDEAIVFGALWFKARLRTDYDNRTAVLEELAISKIHFPEYNDSVRIEKFAKLLTEEIESWNMVMSLDRILTGLEEVEDINSLSVQINNTPPDIYFRTEPAVLLSIDGDPIIDEVEGEKFEYVVNTPFFIVKKKKDYFIKGGKFWHVSKDVATGYKETTKVPNDIEEFAKKNLPDNQLDSIAESLDMAPELIVVTKPSELVATDGKQEYASIEGTQLLYVSNSSDDIVMDINSQKHYVLLAGRWYQSKTLEDNDWTFVEPQDLPSDFAKIPDDSDMANVRVSVPGTQEAQDALLEQIIPQTATVDRKTANVEIKWDGKPKFEKIKDTDIEIAKNSDKTVLLIQSKYYCIDEAIWFVSDSHQGPWIVSDIRPDEIDKIPPESEAYNVKYVYIYDSTPEVVYVGYLPGYTWSYTYHGCVVYGTGYYYNPWYSHYYYPRPVTWGYGVHWNPYTGWGFSYGISYGWVGWHMHPHHGYWGPRGFHAGYRHGYHHGYRRGYYAGYRRGASAARYNNVYRNRSSGVRHTNIPKAGTRPANTNPTTRPSTKPNNIYTDKKGNIYQRDKSGDWNSISNSRPSQQPSQRPTTKPQQKPATKPVTTQPSSRPAQKPQTQPSSRPQTQPSMSNQQQQQLNKSYQNRSHGNTNYNRSRSSGGSNMSRPSGGGGRRR